MTTLSKFTKSALVVSMGIGVWAIYEIRQKNKLERNKQRIHQEAVKSGKTSEKETSPAQ